LAHIYAGADYPMLVRPSTKHLARTATEVKDTGPRCYAQSRAESSQILRRERVVDAMSTFGDVEDPWNVHGEISPYGCEYISLLPDIVYTDQPKLRIFELQPIEDAIAKLDTHDDATLQHFSTKFSR
jgi:hypothetical protein